MKRFGWKAGLAGMLCALCALHAPGAKKAEAEEEDTELSTEERAPVAVTKKGAAKPVVRIKPLGFQAGGQVHQFKWKEFDGDGSRLLEEKGELFGVVFSGETAMGRLENRFDFTVFGGEVDYNGQTWDGTPAKTDIGYLGFDAGVDLAYRQAFTRELSGVGFAGLTWRAWERDIKSKHGLQGYKEDWSVFQGRAGGGLQAKLSPGLKVHAEAGVRIPLFTTERIDLYGGVDLEPKQKASLFAEAGVQWKHLFVTAFYDALEFGKSDPETRRVWSGRGIYTMQIYQPKSEAEIIGVNAGFAATF